MPVPLDTRLPGRQIPVQGGVRQAVISPDGATAYQPRRHAPIAGYSWAFGDGSTHTTTKPALEHTYARAGSYAVSLVVTDAVDTSGQQVWAARMLLRNGSALARAQAEVKVGWGRRLRPSTDCRGVPARWRTSFAPDTPQPPRLIIAPSGRGFRGLSAVGRGADQLGRRRHVLGGDLLVSLAKERLFEVR